MASSEHIVLFDGVCNLCNGFVRFLIRHDHKKKLRFGSLQSKEGMRLLSSQNRIPHDRLYSAVYIRKERYYIKSDAVLKILQDLGGLWQLAGIFWLIPRPLRDIVYDWVGRNRYRWFGKQASCIVPAPELRERFID